MFFFSKILLIELDNFIKLALSIIGVLGSILADLSFASSYLTICSLYPDRILSISIVVSLTPLLRFDNFSIVSHDSVLRRLNCDGNPVAPLQDL
jgi:hypothetical protein